MILNALYISNAQRAYEVFQPHDLTPSHNLSACSGAVRKGRHGREQGYKYRLAKRLINDMNLPITL